MYIHNTHTILYYVKNKVLLNIYIINYIIKPYG